MQKYIRNNKVAILVSQNYGAGWSTWNSKELAYDKRVVEFYLKHKDDEEFMRSMHGYKNQTIKEIEEIFKSWGYENVYFGGFNNIEIYWLPVGTKYYISEDDGWETLKTVDSIQWETA